MLLLRVLLCFPTLLLLIVSLIKLRKSNLLVYLTQWANAVTFLAMILTFLAGQRRNRKRMSLQRSAAVTFQMALFLSLNVTLVYWRWLRYLPMPNDLPI